MRMGRLYSFMLVMIMVIVTLVVAGEGSASNQCQWCVAKHGASDEMLLDAIHYVCGNMKIDCNPINPGGMCYNPQNEANHASFVMNRYYQSRGRNKWNCHFNGTGIITVTDPSYGTCTYDQA